MHEVAKALGTRYSSAYILLRRLEKRGMLSKKFFGRAIMYCGDIVEQLLNKKRNITVKVLVKLAAVREILQSEGCVSTYTLAKMLGVSRGNVRHMAIHLVEGGEAVSMVIGKITIWCRRRAEVEALVERLRNTVHRLATANNFRYVTPSKILRAVKNDKEAYSLFSKFIRLSRIDERFSGVALAFADGVLRLLYGEPAARTSHKTVYIVSQPRVLEIDVRDSIDKKYVSVTIPDDLAEALQGDTEKVILRALEQMLQKFRT
ncbi:MAG: hypothetical protein QXQ91_05095 [Nanopusillaceae archaeon]